MSRIVKVNQGDYVIQTRSGGDIVLDTGYTGLVTITGDLNVLGATTTVGTSNLVVSDNIILLNSGETGNGVTLQTAGVEVDRGLLNNAQILWNETIVHYDPVASANVNGTFVLRVKNGNVSGIQVSTVVAGPADLAFDMGSSTNVLKIVNSTNYESRVLSTNDIPNRKFVTDYVSATGGTANVTNIHYPLTGSQQSSVTATSTTIDFVINSTLKARINSAGLNVNNVQVAGDQITNTGANNLLLTSTNNNVEVKAVFNLDNLEALSGSYDTTVVAGKTKLYTSQTEGPGRTGIYFVNNSVYGNAVYNNDELVSKNRAVLLSILL